MEGTTVCWEREKPMSWTGCRRRTGVCPTLQTVVTVVVVAHDLHTVLAVDAVVVGTAAAVVVTGTVTAAVLTLFRKRVRMSTRSSSPRTGID